MALTLKKPTTPRIPKIEVTDLYKSFGSKKVLQGVTFKVMPGESFVVLGGSGTGKSVLLKCILGIIQPDSGSIKIDGEETVGISQSKRDEIMRKIGMLFQGSALFDSLPVWKNVGFEMFYNENMSTDKIKKIVHNKLKAVDLADPRVMDLSPAELSGGMQKRVGLARAIASEPEILFFDEPTTGLDPIMCGVIDNLIVKCVRTLGATAITITHDIATAQYIADKVGMLKDGKLIWIGNASALKRCKNKVVHAFVTGHDHKRPKPSLRVVKGVRA